jgi:hypothetical protein
MSRFKLVKIYHASEVIRAQRVRNGHFSNTRDSQQHFNITWTKQCSYEGAHYIQGIFSPFFTTYFSLGSHYFVLSLFPPSLASLNMLHYLSPPLSRHYRSLSFLPLLSNYANLTTA